MSGLVEIAQGGNGLSGPCIGENGTIYVCSTGSGEVHRVTAEGDLEVISGGRDGPISLGWADGKIVGADTGGCVFSLGVDASEGMTELASSYKGSALKGPTGVCTSKEGQLYFTDGGPFGTTSLAVPRGSLYVYDPSTQTTSCLAAESLAYPTALCLNPQGSALYVCETSANRILRYIQRPRGVWHGSVFYQFSGLLGPTCIDCDSSGNIFVGRCDFKEQSPESLVSIIRPNGTDLASFSVPGAEISGLALEKTNMELFITEASLNKIFKYKLPDTLE
eukprot:TRINITY_DN382_c3_g1_i1.p1 TRINITY_DN382_c3_g1~~TRINITY_DN382_c3_g1_i1.p1  ORF type:complete len:278 (+),score=20.22 TRINITY_DN382_c3_g1_i1:74-907(+)